MEKSLSFRVNIGDETGSAFKSATTGTLLKAIGNDNIISEPFLMSVSITFKLTSL